ncbi:MAG: hypothetical protein R6V10_00575 [bacterium]
MSHTSQRRGLSPDKPGQEMIVLAMLPSSAKDKPGAKSAMSDLAGRMMDHAPDNWIIKNATEIHVPDLGPAEGLARFLHQHWPEKTDRLLMRAAGYLSTVITALYTDVKNVEELITELKGEWLENNREKDLPVSIVLSGLFKDVHECCQKTGTTEHTYLHSLGFYGNVADLPAPDELEIITMCGHGLIATNRVRDLAGKVRAGAISAREAAQDVARPCVCGIVNVDRAEKIFECLAG